MRAPAACGPARIPPIPLMRSEEALDAPLGDREMSYVVQQMQETKAQLHEQKRVARTLRDEIQRTAEELRGSQLAEQAARKEAAEHESRQPRNRPAADDSTGQRADVGEQSAAAAAEMIAGLRSVIANLQAGLAAAERRADRAETLSGTASKAQLRHLRSQLAEDRREREMHERTREVVLAAERKAREAERRAQDAEHLTRKRALRVRSKALKDMTELADTERRRARALHARLDEQMQRLPRAKPSPRRAEKPARRVNELQAQEALLRERVSASIQILDAEKAAYEAVRARNELEAQLQTTGMRGEEDVHGPQQEHQAQAAPEAEASPESSARPPPPTPMDWRRQHTDRASALGLIRSLHAGSLAGGRSAASGATSGEVMLRAPRSATSDRPNLRAHSRVVLA